MLLEASMAFQLPQKGAEVTPSESHVKQIWQECYVWLCMWRRKRKSCWK